MLKLCAKLGASLVVAGMLAGPAGSIAAAQEAIQPPVPNVSEYQLGAGDKVRVTVYGEQSLSGDFLVAGNGKLSMPLIGEVQATGLTVRMFQDEVQRILSDGYLKQPKVSAEVLNYRPFFILGEVEKPGQYPYTNGLTVMNAVATAGGFTYRANKSRVFVKHANDTTEKAFPLEGTTPVAPGDTIRIGERFF